MARNDNTAVCLACLLCSMVGILSATNPQSIGWRIVLFCVSLVAFIIAILAAVQSATDRSEDQQ